LADRGVATLRYQFPYMELGRGRPDPPLVATATVRSAVEKAGELAPGLPLFAGGKSFGGRMTSTAASESGLQPVAGLIFLGFPLHYPKVPAVTRADHLAAVPQPMLFLQGTKDEMADIGLLRQVVAGLGPRATLVEIAGGNHSFAVPKRAGKSPAEVIAALADSIAEWTARRGTERPVKP
jgi:predicted alpha/beta-hydrolase family hydrolase